ncbi:MAG TPA: S1 RNA-binding domain-containing protein [Bacillota bacterium]|jgi:S1 RNA binding domain protein|nr:S1 RNA-binding domain-containing protein [Candidatus Fermentithermobacillaceae bacterium]HOB30934.1 S1 RNA-binding domain-containing protein [Bacillota bacterium]HOK64730.1 S1 RNA-binding domain-containing protein [Bacillota bacterium]HOL12259.1 S1 RNA-binding domain-containing protein [Bacillota bacterium]HOQ03359.1 S1 RNA-binding domain-containing protein [Bacillota bacterium]
MALEVGAIVEGVVTGVTNFGAFVMLPDGRTGLVHISEIADEYVKDINDYVKKNDTVKVKILSMDDSGRIGLSIKQANPDYQRRSVVESRSNKADFEEKVARFMKESEERQADLKKNVDSKRGGRGSRREI